MLASIGLYLVALSADMQTSPPAVLLDGNRFDCLVTHIDRLIGERERMARRPRVVTVDLARCPPGPPVIRQDFTSWPTYPRGRSARFVRLTASELRCIRANRHRRDQLARNSGDGLYELHLASCRQS